MHLPVRTYSPQILLRTRRCAFQSYSAAAWPPPNRRTTTSVSDNMHRMRALLVLLAVLVFAAVPAAQAVNAPALPARALRRRTPKSCRILRAP